MSAYNRTCSEILRHPPPRNSTLLGKFQFNGLNKMLEDPQYPSLTQTGIPAENRIRGPVKVILLGNSNVGKSSIIAYLKDNVSTDQKTQMSTIRGPALLVCACVLSQNRSQILSSSIIRMNVCSLKLLYVKLK
jgi:hypothetical protein